MVDPRFAHAEQQYDWLKAELDAGRMTGATFERAVWDAMFESGGRFWMLGANSRQWYVSDGDGWVASSPPPSGRSPEPVAGPTYSTPAKRSVSALVLAVVVLIGVTAFAVFCFRSGYQAWTDGDRIGGGIAIGFGLVLVAAMVSGAIARTRR